MTMRGGWPVCTSLREMLWYNVIAASIYNGELTAARRKTCGTISHGQVTQTHQTRTKTHPENFLNTITSRTMLHKLRNMFSVKKMLIVCRLYRSVCTWTMTGYRKQAHGIQESCMMTSWRGNAFHITGPLWGESSGFPSQRASNVGFWYFICC